MDGVPILTGATFRPARACPTGVKRIMKTILIAIKITFSEKRFVAICGVKWRVWARSRPFRNAQFRYAAPFFCIIAKLLEMCRNILSVRMSQVQNECGKRNDSTATLSGELRTGLRLVFIEQYFHLTRSSCIFWRGWNKQTSVYHTNTANRYRNTYIKSLRNCDYSANPRAHSLPPPAGNAPSTKDEHIIQSSNLLSLGRICEKDNLRAIVLFL